MAGPARGSFSEGGFESMVRRRTGKRSAQSVDTDLVRALEAMTAPELRAFVRGVLDEFEAEQRARVIDSLMTRAARHPRSARPSDV